MKPVLKEILDIALGWMWVTELLFCLETHRVELSVWYFKLLTDRHSHTCVSDHSDIELTGQPAKAWRYLLCNTSAGKSSCQCGCVCVGAAEKEEEEEEEEEVGQSLIYLMLIVTHLNLEWKLNLKFWRQIETLYLTFSADSLTQSPFNSISWTQSAAPGSE